MKDKINFGNMVFEADKEKYPNLIELAQRQQAFLREEELNKIGVIRCENLIRKWKRV